MTPHLRAGAIAAIATLLIDQASKLWLLYVFDLASRGVVRVTPFFDLVLAWNVGISFGWFQSENQFAQIALIAIKAVAVIVLGDLDGAVADPAGDAGARPDHRRRGRQRHRPLPPWRGGRFRPVSTSRSAEIGYNWYVFNLADVAIVAGVAALLYDSFLGVPAAKAP